MQFSRKLLMANYIYPTVFTAPTSYTTTLVASTSGAQYTTYNVPEDGWYQVSVMGGGGRRSSAHASTGHGGLVSRLVYLYQGMTCLLWSGAVGGSYGAAGACGYPGTQDSTLGGKGGRGRISHDDDGYSVESGGSGGGAACSGTNGNTGHATGGGGAGSGFMAGFTANTMPTQNVTLGDMTLGINRILDAGAVNYVCVPTYLLCGGGGGAENDNGHYRVGGAGGGAFGSGGTTYRQSYGVDPAAGPAGSWGKGGNAPQYSRGGDGAWAIADFSTNSFDWGQGGGDTETDGYCQLYSVTAN